MSTTMPSVGEASRMRCRSRGTGPGMGPMKIRRRSSFTPLATPRVDDDSRLGVGHHEVVSCRTSAGEGHERRTRGGHLVPVVRRGEEDDVVSLVHQTARQGQQGCGMALCRRRGMQHVAPGSGGRRDGPPDAPRPSRRDDGHAAPRSLRNVTAPPSTRAGPSGSLQGEIQRARSVLTVTRAAAPRRTSPYAVGHVEQHLRCPRALAVGPGPLGRGQRPVRLSTARSSLARRAVFMMTWPAELESTESGIAFLVGHVAGRRVGHGQPGSHARWR